MKVKRIEEIDRNFTAKGPGGENIIYADVFEYPFKIFGMPLTEGLRVYCRFTPQTIDQFSEDVKCLAWHTSGVRVRFKTDSPFISIKAEIASGADMSHMPRSGSSGFDIYTGSRENRAYLASVMPQHGITEYEGIAYARKETCQEWTVNFPLYNGVKRLSVGLQQGSMLEKAPEYTLEKPIVFYGSSITQGGCASRPGNSYPNIISRWLDADIYNLGFSGSAIGEPEMAHYIAGLDMSAFVLDYDHNAPNTEHLIGTHERFFKIIREVRPLLPIIIVSRPNFEKDPENNRKRREIIFRTFKNAVDSGDQNVYFIDGETLFGRENRDSCTVDGCHPNDLGFMRMAEVIYPVLKQALETS